MNTIDGTNDKSRLGANAILAVSLAVSRCAAKVERKKLYARIGPNRVLPIPQSNFINGGKHAGSSIKIQEFQVLPTKVRSFSQAVRALSETYLTLKELIIKKYGKSSINVGDEGGFVPQLSKIDDGLNIIIKAIEEAGYSNKLFLGFDAAASEFYSWKSQKYNLESKKQFTKDEMVDYYLDLVKRFPVVSIEDPFDQDDFDSFREFTKKSKIQVVGDDLLVTNPERIDIGIKEKLCNALLLKPNQIGTVSESIKAGKMALKNKWKVIASHRSGETCDNFISDFAVGLGANQIKIGAPCRGERTSKYNQLLRIEEEVRDAKYAKF